MSEMNPWERDADQVGLPPSPAFENGLSGRFLVPRHDVHDDRRTLVARESEPSPRCPFRQKDLDPYFTVEEIEEARRSLAKRLQGWARAEKRAEYDEARAARRAEYDKARGKRVSGRRLNDRPQGGMIVGVDSEGVKVENRSSRKRAENRAEGGCPEMDRCGKKRLALGSAHVYGWRALKRFGDAISLQPDGLQVRIFEFLCLSPAEILFQTPRQTTDLRRLQASAMTSRKSSPTCQSRNYRRFEGPWVKRNDPTWRANYRRLVVMARLRDRSIARQEDQDLQAPRSEPPV
jgi:hypothetical protein